VCLVIDVSVRMPPKRWSANNHDDDVHVYTHMYTHIYIYIYMHNVCVAMRAQASATSLESTTAELETLKSQHERALEEVVVAESNISALELQLEEVMGQAAVARAEVASQQAGLQTVKLLLQRKEEADDRIHMLELNFDELSGQSAIVRVLACVCVRDQ